MAPPYTRSEEEKEWQLVMVEKVSSMAELKVEMAPPYATSEEEARQLVMVEEMRVSADEEARMAPPFSDEPLRRWRLFRVRLES